MDKKIVMELPIMGLHMGYGNAKLLYHERPRKLSQRFVVDHAAYLAELNKVRELNKIVWDNSETKLPAELYSHYRVSKGVESFRSLMSETSNLKVRDPITGNSFWACDVGQVVQGLGRMVDRAELENVIVEVDARYTSDWKKVLSVFGTGKVRKISSKVFQVREKSEPVEQYNKYMKLMYVFPSLSAAAEFNKTSVGNLDDAAKKHRELNGCFFRYYYDNRFLAMVNCLFEQVQDEIVVNRFKSVSEASEVLDIPKYTLYRLLRNPTSTDKYGCTWRKVAKN